MTTSKLFTPLQVGKMTLQNRLVLAPLTRFRADDNHVPILPMVKEYYAQRACVPGTLLVSEATYISRQAMGYPNAPGLFRDEQLKAWKEITDAVHERGCFIYCQLWAMGRAAVPAFMKANGLDMISSSATPMDGKSEAPRSLTEEEIEDFIKAYADAARAAVEVAGFDGVEIHAANGYLVDQFTQDTCNKRTDKWGGSVENRSRFATAVATAVADAVGAERTGIRLSPWSTFQGMRMENPVPQFTHLINQLKPLNLAYLHLVESRIEDGTPMNSLGESWNRSKHSNIEALDSLAFAFQIWNNQSPIFLAGGFKPKEAYDTADGELKDTDVCIVFGRWWIANPDLVFRIREGIELSKYDRDTFYKAKSVDGYIDYKFSKEWEERKEIKL